MILDGKEDKIQELRLEQNNKKKSDGIINTRNKSLTKTTKAKNQNGKPKKPQNVNSTSTTSTSTSTSTSSL